MTNIFTYGSLILESSKIQLQPTKSVFLRGYKILVQKSPVTTKNYHNLLLIPTGNKDDIVAGYIAPIEDAVLPQLDGYEGSSYTRIEVTVYTRQLEEVKAFAYLKKIG